MSKKLGFCEKHGAFFDECEKCVMKKRISELEAKNAQYEQEIARLSSENELLSRDRDEVLSYLEAVRHCTGLRPDGYAIVDFQRVWLEQKDVEIAKLRSLLELATELKILLQSRSIFLIQRKSNSIG